MGDSSGIIVDSSIISSERIKHQFLAPLSRPFVLTSDHRENRPLRFDPPLSPLYSSVPDEYRTLVLSADRERRKHRRLIRRGSGGARAGRSVPIVVVASPLRSVFPRFTAAPRHLDYVSPAQKNERPFVFSVGTPGWGSFRGRTHRAQLCQRAASGTWRELRLRATQRRQVCVGGPNGRGAVDARRW